MIVACLVPQCMVRELQDMLTITIVNKLVGIGKSQLSQASNRQTELYCVEKGNTLPTTEPSTVEEEADGLSCTFGLVSFEHCARVIVFFLQYQLLILHLLP